jgi:hypothetical protein
MRYHAHARRATRATWCVIRKQSDNRILSLQEPGLHSDGVLTPLGRRRSAFEGTLGRAFRAGRPLKPESISTSCTEQ